MTLEDGLLLMAAGFCTGFGLKFADWIFEKIRAMEKKASLKAAAKIKQ